jgi:glycosyltransferase involved in cell wall biosynthesis
MLLIPPRDPQSLAEAVARLRARPQLKKTLASGAEALAARFSWEQIARKTATFFRALLNGSER